jgi:hypothetical protein
MRLDRAQPARAMPAPPLEALVTGHGPQACQDPAGQDHGQGEATLPHSRPAPRCLPFAGGAEGQRPGRPCGYSPHDDGRNPRPATGRNPDRCTIGSARTPRPWRRRAGEAELSKRGSMRASNAVLPFAQTRPDAKTQACPRPFLGLLLAVSCCFRPAGRAGDSAQLRHPLRRRPRHQRPRLLRP